MFTQKYVNELSYEIIGCAIEVHRQLEPGLLESIYEICLLEELTSIGFDVKSQVQVPIFYKGKLLQHHLRVDLLIENLIIVELKAIEQLLELHKAQLLTYLKLFEKPKGLLLNFNCTNIIQKGLISLVTDQFAAPPKI